MSVYFYEPFYNWDRFFDEALSSRSHQAGPNNQLTHAQHNPGANQDLTRFFKPKMDLHENPASNSVTATFELPGVKKEDVNLEVHNNRLTVSAETKISSDHEQDGYAVRERRFGKFSRTLQLPQGVKDTEIKASMADGILTLTFPKAGENAAPQRISVA